MPRVLVVDDSLSVRRFLSDALADRGWEVETAEDAEQAAVRALSSPPDVVVSDLWMPGLSGLQLCRLLHEDPSTAHVPVVLLSAAGDRRSRFWAARSGASAFLDKTAVSQLPDLLADLVARAPRAVAPARSRPVRASSVPGRLSQLLDRALFDAVLASEIRGLALASADVPALFSALAALLNDVMPYRWLALETGGAGEGPTYVHVHPDEQRGAEDEALVALGRAGKRATLVVADARCAPPTGRRAPAVVHAVGHAGMELGSLAMCVAGPSARPEESSLVALAAREIALPVRLVTLLEQTRHVAATDALTGVANRRTAVEALSRAVAGSGRYAHPLSIAIVDVDLFKRVNDTLGHNGGDEALRHIAAVLSRGVRASDLVARWGGEEFLVVLAATGEQGARVAAERLRIAVANSPAIVAGSPLVLTVSIGVATFAGELPDALIARADEALYRAKRSGRNRVEIEPSPAA